MAERLVQELRAPYLIADQPVVVTSSIGIASARDAVAGAADLVRNADVAMYMAKANGKSGFAIFDPGMHEAIRERHELSVELQRAVDLDQLRLVYQPIIDLATGRFAGVEALVRWHHPERGLIMPGRFIEIAEENGAILPIGRWVLREACSRGRAAGCARAWPRLDVRRRQRVGPRGPAARASSTASATRFARPASSRRTSSSRSPRPPCCGRRRRRSPRSTSCARSASGPSSTTSGPATSRSATCASSRSTSSRSPASSSRTPTPIRSRRRWPGRSSPWAARSTSRRSPRGSRPAEQAASMRALGCTYGQGYFFSYPLSEHRRRRGLRQDRLAEADPPRSRPRPVAAASAQARTRPARLTVARTSPAGLTRPGRAAPRPAPTRRRAARTAPAAGPQRRGARPAARASARPASAAAPPSACIRCNPSPEPLRSMKAPSAVRRPVLDVMASDAKIERTPDAGPANDL